MLAAISDAAMQVIILHLCSFGFSFCLNGLPVQVVELVAWSALGTACGIYSDTVPWHSAHSIPGPLAMLVLILKASGPYLAASFFLPSYYVGSRIRVIGLTGGIASGKSTATAFIRKMGVPVVDADEVSHRILQKGKPAYWRVRKAFREHAIVDAEENIDRTALRTLVINNKELNKKLKKCTHAAIAWEIFLSVSLVLVGSILPVLNALEPTECTFAVPVQMWTQSILLRHPVVVLDAPLLFESK